MIPLATVADEAQVERLRPQVEGRACVLVGSAPMSGRVTVEADDVVVPINGGISSAPRADVWFLGSKEQDKPSNHLYMTPLHRQMLEQCRGRRAGHVVLLRGPKRPTEAYTLDTLRRLSCAVDSWSVFDKPTKLWIERNLCDRKKDTHPCSSGVLAAACVLWCGASSVRLEGFSLAPGYHYVTVERPKTWWRNHVEADTRALVALRARYGAALSGSILDTVAA